MYRNALPIFNALRTFQMTSLCNNLNLTPKYNANSCYSGMKIMSVNEYVTEPYAFRKYNTIILQAMDHCAARPLNLGAYRRIFVT